MHLTTGLRLARIHPSIRSHGPWPYTLTPLISAIPNPPKRLGPSSSLHLRRLASTSTTSQSQPKNGDATPIHWPPKSAAELISSTTRITSPLPPSSLLNPPASTRPPPLDLPTRDPNTSLFRYLYHLGKAYMTFYKAGLYAIIINRRLLSQASSTAPPQIPGSTTFPSRSDILLRSRVRHDLSRLPIFGLLMLICGEFTPLIVIIFPRLTPLTCRIPKQTDALRLQSETRREKSFRALKYHVQSTTSASQINPDIANGHICRSLGLTTSFWDRIGMDGPFATGLARRAVHRIAVDDAMIREGGGVDVLVDEEVVLACEDRGIKVRDLSVDDLRKRLEVWLQRTAPDSEVTSKEAAQKEAEGKVTMALLEPDEKE
ncbi:uncharacterized protein F4822DRAFT_414484 [Hypoxylon trugodes]|uniref:uncharacterized protein n=1 Tax=Hypoxylon trugodes TaxID=326681 RepID=UPI00219B9CA8|nr:uncharacterized protein F4822DRAFT_414484 [Hypoxylon trugodes]KAI1385928.1 hypothetical protein F4822DRAFT_414484 [Hypoxylon trugodes]